MRKKIYDIVSGDTHSIASLVYAVAMIAFIVMSLVPLCVRGEHAAFAVTEAVCVTVFILDYIARWATADYKLRKGAKSFLLYPFTPMALIDLASILPFFLMFNPTLRMLRVTRLLLTLRAFKLIRYSQGLSLVINGVSRQAVPLAFVCIFTIAYVLICAILVFNAEPETFSTYFEAVYWAVISLTTVGYGDLYPVTDAGRAIATVSAFVGVAVIALPSSIITAGVVDELQNTRERIDQLKESDRETLEQIEQLKKEKLEKLKQLEEGERVKLKQLEEGDRKKLKRLTKNGRGTSNG